MNLSSAPGIFFLNCWFFRNAAVIAKELQIIIVSVAPYTGSPLPVDPTMLGIPSLMEIVCGLEERPYSLLSYVTHIILKLLRVALERQADMISPETSGNRLKAYSYLQPIPSLPAPLR